MNSGKLRWIKNISSTRPPQCFRCIHYFGKRRCKAFPNKDIPRDYLTEKVKHQITLGNQIGNFIYEAKESFIKDDKEYELIGKQAISELDSNKKKLPGIIRERIKEKGGKLELIERLEITSSGPLRSRFDLQIEFFPKEELVQLGHWEFEGMGIVAKIIRALEAKNLEPKFKLTVFKNGDYKYE